MASIHFCSKIHDMRKDGIQVPGALMIYFIFIRFVDVFVCKCIAVEITLKISVK